MLSSTVLGIGDVWVKGGKQGPLDLLAAWGG